MEFYTRRVFPRLLDLAMRNPWATRERRRLVPRATGVVLEIGAGSGLNFTHYTRSTGRVIALEPSPGLARVASRRRVASPVRVDWMRGVGEALPLADASVDTVVLTWTLCSVADPTRSLAELRRVLKSAGRLLFVEHGRAPDAAVRRWQERITPQWRRVSGNCHLDRPIETLIRAAGFEVPELEAEYVGLLPKTMTYFYRGMATPTAPAPASPNLTPRGGFSIMWAP